MFKNAWEFEACRGDSVQTKHCFLSRKFSNCIYQDKKQKRSSNVFLAKSGWGVLSRLYPYPSTHPPSLIYFSFPGSARCLSLGSRHMQSCPLNTASFSISLHPVKFPFKASHFTYTKLTLTYMLCRMSAGLQVLTTEERFNTLTFF